VDLIKAQGNENANDLLAIFESLVSDDQGVDESRNQAIVLIASLAPFLENVLQKKTVACFELLIDVSMNTKSEIVRKSICKCIP
jgi:hypothetical protein